MWTDEKRCWYSSDGQVRVCHSHGQAYNDCMRVVVSQGGRSINWSSTYDQKITLEVDEGNMTVSKYRNEIQLYVTLPFQQAHLAKNFILVDDNAISHPARVFTALACSPDLNMIGHAPDMLQWAVCARQPALNSWLSSVSFQEEWNNMDQNKLRWLVRSIPYSCLEVIQARGSYNRYWHQGHHWMWQSAF